MNDNNKDVFCMAPWLHLHIWPDGTAHPCCMSDSKRSLGNINKSALAEIWNSAELKQIRKNMLEGKKSPECSRCYEIESSTETLTLRKALNENYKHHLPHVKKTESDGRVEGLNLAYLDIRFSNICNMKCRTCGPIFSSSWYEDFVKMHGPFEQKKLLTVNDQDQLYNQLEPLLSQVEEVFFAGGEALITEEHYRLLDYWLKAGLTRVKLRYTTNFSVLSFVKRNILEYWKIFSNVRVSASLDGMGERAEYIRKNTEWSKIEENRKKMLIECPNVYFEIAVTISVYNVFHFPDFHRAWVEKQLVAINNVRVGFLIEPAHQKAQVLPLSLKKEILEKYDKHLNWIDQYSVENKINTEKIKKQILDIKNFLMAEDKSQLLSFFVKETIRLDQIREEDFFVTFPELKSLEDYA